MKIEIKVIRGEKDSIKNFKKAMYELTSTIYDYAKKKKWYLTYNKEDMIEGDDEMVRVYSIGKTKKYLK